MIDLELGEEVREIDGFPNYFVTSFGRVISGPKRWHESSYIELVPKEDKYGYLTLSLRRNNRGYSRTIHTLVARAFIPNPLNLPTVNHKKGEQKWNNGVDNLEWATRREQKQHAMRTGLHRLDPDWGVRFQIKNPPLKKPYHVYLRLFDGRRRSFGCYETKEEARLVRDRVCAEHGLIRPVGDRDG